MSETRCPACNQLAHAYLGGRTRDEKGNYIHSYVGDERNAAIEECAKVVEKLHAKMKPSVEFVTTERVVQEIRALKKENGQ